MSMPYRRPLRAACSLLALVSAAPVLAQAPAEGTGVLDEIIVTATRRATSVQDVPYNISVLGGGDVGKLGLSDISELSRMTPGLALVDAGPRNTSSTIIRGLSVDPLRTPDTEDNGTVATYINETPLLIQPKLIDIDRVEVLRGPQGTLYGSGSLGGAIRYIVNNPDFRGASGSAGVKIYTIKQADSLSYETSGVINTPLVEDKLALRLAVNYLDDSGFIDAPLIIGGGREDVDSEKRLTARLSATWKPAEWLDLTGSFYFDRQKAGGRTAVNPGFRPDPVDGRPLTQPAVTLGKYDNGTRYDEPADARYRIYALEAKADLGFAELVSSSSYVKQQDNGQRDQSDLLLGFEYGYEDYPGFSAFTREDDDLEVFVQEVRLVSQHEGPLQYVAGVYMADDDLISLSKEFVPGFPGFIGVNRPDNLEYYEAADIRNREYALFGELTYNITDAWQITGGARWFKLKQNQDFCLAFPLIDGSGPTEIAADCEGGRSNIDDAIFKVNSSYQINDDVMAYATFSQGFRRGGANSVPVGGQVVIDPAERFYNPDTVDNYEAGIRSTLLDGRMTLNTALFNVNWVDIQVLTRTAEGSIPITANAGEARSRGLELESRLSVTETVTLSGGYAFIDAELTQDTPTRTGLFAKGTRLPGSPRHAINLGLDVEQPVGDLGDLTWHIDGSYSGGITTSANLLDNSGAANPDATSFGGYALVNASLTLDASDGWMARAYVRNIFDEYAYVGQRGPSAYGDQGRFYLIPRPRVIGIELGKSF